MKFLSINSEISEYLQLYISGILENCVIEFQNNIVAADKIETTPDKNVVIPPVSSPSFCLLLQNSVQSRSEALEQHVFLHLLGRAGKG